MTKYFVIPARGGSKGIKNKNLRKISKYSLVEWSIIHALFLANKRDRIIVSSDSNKILKIANKYSVDAQLRPKNLSGDKVFTEPVMKYALSKYQINHDDIIVLLQPTSPLRRKKTLNSALRAINSKEFVSALTVQELHQFKWDIQDNFVGKPLYDKRPRRQDMKPEYVENGSIYMTRYKNFLKSNNRVSGKTKLITSETEESIDIDNMVDMKVTRTLADSFVKEWSSFIENLNLIN